MAVLALALALAVLPTHPRASPGVPSVSACLGDLMSFTWSVFLNRGLRPLTTTCNQFQVLISHFTAANPVYPYRVSLACQLMSPVTCCRWFQVL